MAYCGPYLWAKTLGKGGYSIVKEAEHEETGQKVALKIMKRISSDSLGNLFKQEVTMMKELDSEHLIRLVDFSDQAVYTRESGEEADVYYIALELGSGGELFDYIAETGCFDEKVARYYFHQIIEGLEYMHNKGLSHQDIKPENMLFDDEFNLKITDFGFTSDDLISTQKKGTPSYMSPELYKGKKYNTQSADLFAAAIVLFIMVSQKPPFNKASADDPYYKAMTTMKSEAFWKAHSRTWSNPEVFNQNFRELFESMVAQNPHERPSLAEIKASDWYNQPVATTEEIKEEFSERKEHLDYLKKVTKEEGYKKR